MEILEKIKLGLTEFKKVFIQIMKLHSGQKILCYKLEDVRVYHLSHSL